MVIFNVLPINSSGIGKQIHLHPNRADIVHQIVRYNKKRWMIKADFHQQHVAGVAPFTPASVFQELPDKGTKEVRPASVYAPMGLNIASIEPKEIALSNHQ